MENVDRFFFCFAVIHALFSISMRVKMFFVVVLMLISLFRF